MKRETTIEESALNALSAQICTEADATLSDKIWSAAEHLLNLADGIEYMHVFTLPEVNQTAQRTTVNATPMELLCITCEALIESRREANRAAHIRGFINKAQGIEP